MGKKKREHVVFDLMLKPKKSIPFPMVNKQNAKGKNNKKMSELRDNFSKYLCIALAQKM